MSSPSLRRLASIPTMLVLLAVACSERSSPPPVDGAPRQDGSGAGDTGACVAGALTPVGRICIGSQGSTPVSLVAGQPLTFHVYPKGCLSSSATKVRKAVCSVSASGSTLQVDATFCLENLGCQQGCTADCNGGGFASCTTAGLPAGTYAATVGGLTLSFTVPSTLTYQSQCTGDQF